MISDIVRKYGIKGKGFSLRDNRIIKNMKAVHMLAAIAWGGGAFAMQALGILERSLSDKPSSTLVAHCAHFVDTWVVMPGLFGCILTGLFYSLFTSIGFFRFAWIAYKWLISASACFWGLLFWSRLGDRLILWLDGYGMAAPLLFIRSCILPENIWGTVLQTSIIMSMCLVSVYRPVSFHFSMYGSNKRDLGLRKAAAINADLNAHLQSPLDNTQVQALYNNWLGEPLGPQSRKLLHQRLLDKSQRLERLRRADLYPPKINVAGNS